MKNAPRRRNQTNASRRCGSSNVAISSLLVRVISGVLRWRQISYWLLVVHYLAQAGEARVVQGHASFGLEGHLGGDGARCREPAGRRRPQAVRRSPGLLRWQRPWRALRPPGRCVGAGLEGSRHRGAQRWLKGPVSFGMAVMWTKPPGAMLESCRDAGRPSYRPGRGVVTNLLSY